MVLAVEPAYLRRGLRRHPPRARVRRARGRQRNPHQIRAHAVKVALVEPIVVNVPYSHREVSSIVARDGVTDILVRVTTDDGLVGWGEATSGSDAASVEAAVTAMAPFVDRARPLEPRRDARRRVRLRPLEVPRRHGQLRLGRHRHGARGHLRQGRRPAALAPARRRAAQRRDVLLLPRARRATTICARRSRQGSRPATTSSISRSAVDDREDERMVATLRDALGPGPRLRIDANSSWSLPQARAHARATRASTTSTSSSSPCARRRAASSASCAARSPIAVCANEGLWSEDDAYARIRAREADVLLLLAVLGRLAGRVLAARARRRARGPAGLQAHPRRARDRGGRVPARAADAAERRRRAPADGADDGARRAHRAAADRDRRALGVDRRARVSASRSTPTRSRRRPARYRSEGQYLPWQPYHARREDRP